MSAGELANDTFHQVLNGLSSNGVYQAVYPAAYDQFRCIVSSNPCMRNHTLECLIAHAGITADNAPEKIIGSRIHNSKLHMSQLAGLFPSYTA